ncbi:hypothetical protein [Nocardia sp. NPDC127526]|uniref:hypothetical protein n=1 Tax=Nocardia sp. NPDC127526 TaxID=3345393 RepID=UPI0036414A6E
MQSTKSSGSRRLARVVVAGAITVVPLAALVAPAAAAPSASVGQVRYDAAKTDKPKCKWVADLSYDHSDGKWEHKWVWVCPGKQDDDRGYENNPNR